MTIAAPPVPLRGVASDADYLRSKLDSIEGDVVLVGHSYGGAVITTAGDHEKVKALVYIAGYAPDEGESLGQLQGQFPDSPLAAALVFTPLPDGDQDVSVDPAKFPDIFAADVPREQTEFLAISQRPAGCLRVRRARAGRCLEDEAFLRAHSHRRQHHQSRSPQVRVRAGGDDDRGGRGGLARGSAVEAERGRRSDPQSPGRSSRLIEARRSRRIEDRPEADQRPDDQTTLCARPEATLSKEVRLAALKSRSSRDEKVPWDPPALDAAMVGENEAMRGEAHPRHSVGIADPRTIGLQNRRFQVRVLAAPSREPGRGAESLWPPGPRRRRRQSGRCRCLGRGVGALSGLGVQARTAMPRSGIATHDRARAAAPDTHGSREPPSSPRRRRRRPV